MGGNFWSYYDTRRNGSSFTKPNNSNFEQRSSKETKSLGFKLKRDNLNEKTSF